MAYTERMAGMFGAGHVQRSAEWLKTEYPATAVKLLPKLRELYRKHSK